MKRLFLFLSLVPFLILAGCDIFSTPVETWTVSGTLTVKGTVSHEVRVAAFYEPSGANTIVGQSAVVPAAGTFSLTVDAGALTPADGDEIMLYAYEDSDASGTYTTADVRIALESSQDASSNNTCPVFGDTLFAGFVYYGTADTGLFGHAKGWNVDNAMATDVSIESTALTGSLVENWLDF